MSVNDFYDYGEDWDENAGAYAFLENSKLYANPSTGRLELIAWDVNSSMDSVQMDPFPEPGGEEHLLGYLLSNPSWRNDYRGHLDRITKWIEEDGHLSIIEKIYRDASTAMARHNKQWESIHGIYDLDAERVQIKSFLKARAEFLTQRIKKDRKMNPYLPTS